jgi:hypothetical protein
MVRKTLAPLSRQFSRESSVSELGTSSTATPTPPAESTGFKTVMSSASSRTQTWLEHTAVDDTAEAEAELKVGCEYSDEAAAHSEDVGQMLNMLGKQAISRFQEMAFPMSEPLSWKLIALLVGSCMLVFVMGVTTARAVAALQQPGSALDHPGFAHSRNQHDLLKRLDKHLTEIEGSRRAQSRSSMTPKESELFRNIKDHVNGLLNATADCGGPRLECPSCEGSTTTSTTEGNPCSTCKCLASRKPLSKKADGQHSQAFVTMAHDEVGSDVHLMGALALARALKRFSSYPLVVLTNSTNFADGTQVAESFAKLNSQVLPLRAIDAPELVKKDRHRATAWWKLQIWNLTQFEKLIWMDSDSILYRSIDWLFDRQWMWAQRDDWYCEKVEKVSTGILLLQPNRNDFQGLLEFAARQADNVVNDQELISSFFKDVRQKPISLLANVEASFGHCLGKAAAAFRDPESENAQEVGLWDTPAFVHQSGGSKIAGPSNNNICFQTDVEKQLYTVGGLTINVCHFHPLGQHWRQLFCEAVVEIGLRTSEAQSFCDDTCWYQGKAGDGQGTCRHLSKIINASDLQSRFPAKPVKQ